MQAGHLTVTGEGSTSIPLSGRPRDVLVRFKPAPDPTPCNPFDHHHDKDHLSHRIDHEDEDKKNHHKPGHHHHDRKFFLLIKWRVGQVREIDWVVVY